MSMPKGRLVAAKQAAGSVANRRVIDVRPRLVFDIFIRGLSKPICCSIYAAVYSTYTERFGAPSFKIFVDFMFFSALIVNPSVHGHDQF
jgi:hypothetical protein